MIRFFSVFMVFATLAGCSKEPDDQALQAVLDQAVVDGLPGVSVALANKEGVLWTGVSGYADIQTQEPITKDMLFGVGSITKTFIAVITLQLVEEGKLDLQATPLDILGKNVIGGVPGADKATLAQLLNHTSGIPSWEDDPIWIKEGRGEKLDISHLWGRAETLKYIEGTPLTHVPGDKFSYANTNHTLLGLIIEKVTQHHVTVEIKNRILAPLGLKDIYLEGFQPVPENRLPHRYHYITDAFMSAAGIAKGLVKVNDRLFDATGSNLSVEWTAGGVVATATDMAKYAVALRDGKLLKPESMAYMEEWFPLKDYPGAEVGHGVFRLRMEDGTWLIGHTGGVLGFSASMQWVEGEDLVLVVLSNVGTMHIGKSLPNAASLLRSSNLLKEARSYSK